MKKVPTAEEIREREPLPEALRQLKEKRDEELKAILDGRDDRFVLVVGPCSADHIEPVCEYVKRLGKVQERVREKVMIIPRIYTNKPRTRGVGYKGIFSQPDPNADPDIERGIYAIRKMHIRAMTESGLTGADEMLYPENAAYVDDLLTYITVGARSSENQMHRLVASGLDMPVGIKNPMSGNLPVLLNSVYAAQQPQVFKYHDYQVCTPGNPYAHAVLRGAVDTEGRNVPNYHYEDLLAFTGSYKKAGLKNPAVIVDANHSNSDKQPKEQLRIVREVLESRAYNKELSRVVRGFMVESYLLSGSQSIDGGEFGKSITDACIGWEDTERLIDYVAERS